MDKPIRRSFNLTTQAYTALNKLAGKLGLTQQKAFELVVSDLAKGEIKRPPAPRRIRMLSVFVPRRVDSSIRQMASAAGTFDSHIVERAVRKAARSNGIIE